jgi:hypothetical protein
MVVLYAPIAHAERTPRTCEVSHIPARTSAVFDDPNLVSHGGLVPVMALVERAALPELLAEHVRPGGECGVNAHLKIGCLVAGMTAGADSIDDMGLLRHGAMACCSAGSAPRPRWVAPALLRLRQRPAGREGRPGAAGEAPGPGAAAPGGGCPGLRRRRIDAETGLRAGQQGAQFGHTKIQGKSVLVRGLNALIAIAGDAWTAIEYPQAIWDDQPS